MVVSYVAHANQLFQVVVKPVQGGIKGGFKGAVKGIGRGLVGVTIKPVAGCLVCFISANASVGKGQACLALFTNVRVCKLANESLVSLATNTLGVSEICNSVKKISASNVIPRFSKMIKSVFPWGDLAGVLEFASRTTGGIASSTDGRPAPLDRVRPPRPHDKVLEVFFVFLSGHFEHSLTMAVRCV